MQTLCFPQFSIFFLKVFVVVQLLFSIIKISRWIPGSKRSVKQTFAHPFSSPGSLILFINTHTQCSKPWFL